MLTHYSPFNPVPYAPHLIGGTGGHVTCPLVGQCAAAQEVQGGACRGRHAPVQGAQVGGWGGHVVCHIVTCGLCILVCMNVSIWGHGGDPDMDPGPDPGLDPATDPGSDPDLDPDLPLTVPRPPTPAPGD